MSNLFVADPVVLKAEGNTVLDQAGQFNQNVEKIYSTLNEMLSGDYLSPAARAIGNKILSKRDDLDAMTKVMNDYGTYCVTTSGTVNNNEQNIIDNYTSGN